MARSADAALRGVLGRATIFHINRANSTSKTPSPGQRHVSCPCFDRTNLAPNRVLYDVYHARMLYFVQPPAGHHFIPIAPHLKSTTSQRSTASMKHHTRLHHISEGGVRRPARAACSTIFAPKNASTWCEHQRCTR